MLKNYFFISRRFVVILILISVVLFALLVRFPFLPRDIDFNNDAQIYSRNMKLEFFSGRYNVQMPGYICYIYLGRLLYAFISNTVAVQHIINILMTAFISLSFFFLMKKFDFSNIESFFYSVLFSFNNILMLGSLTGGNRLFLTLGSILLIYLALQIVIDGRKNLIILFSVIFAVIIGFRQDFSFYFIFLYIYLFIKVKDFKLIAVSLLLFGLISLCWFIPLILEYEGIKGYMNKMDNSDAIKNTSIFFSDSIISPLLNMSRIFIYMLNAFLPVLPVFIWTLIKRDFKIPGRVLIILALSFFPSLIFQMLVHNGNFVQLAAFMTPLFIFLIYNFKINSKLKYLFVSILILLSAYQFFGIRMLDDSTRTNRIINTLWLQYSYEGVKSGKTLRLNEKETERIEKKNINTD